MFAGAPEGIKFALGENPKRSNFVSPVPRYPQTRMGVANLIRERSSRRATTASARWSIGPSARAPARCRLIGFAAGGHRRDPGGKRQIHCHSYVKGEILR